MKQPNEHAWHLSRLLGLALLALLFVGWTPRAHAAGPNCTAQSATLSLPSTIVVQPTDPAGPFGPTGTAQIVFTCSGLPASTATPDYTATIQGGQYLANLDSTNVAAGPGITFATGITGLALYVTASPVQASSRACLACGPTSTAGYVPGSVTAPSSAAVGSYSGTVVANFTAQFVKTTSGAVSAGLIPQTNLIPWWWYISGGSVASTSASLGANLILGATTVTVPTCSVSGGSNFSVTLPGVNTNQLTTSGQVAGTTPFPISISGCPNGTNTATNLFSSSNVDGSTGALINAGTAQNVEIQLLNGPGGSKTSGSIINVSKTSNNPQGASTYNVVNNAVTLNYFAQYLATGAATAGTVSATATYTITYQ